MRTASRSRMPNSIAGRTSSRSRSPTVTASVSERWPRCCSRRIPAMSPTYLALAKLGAVTAGINPRMATDEKQRVLDQLAPDLVVDDDFLLERTTGEAPPVLKPDPQRITTIVFTSGTTGEPKGAVFADRQLEAIATIDIGGLDTWGDGRADARVHPVLPHRLHDEAAVVPPARLHARAAGAVASGRRPAARGRAPHAVDRRRRRADRPLAPRAPFRDLRPVAGADHRHRRRTVAARDRA